jgi:hypothetical protein
MSFIKPVLELEGGFQIEHKMNLDTSALQKLTAQSLKLQKKLHSYHL